MDIYKEAVQTLKRTQIDHFKSDLYILMTHESINLIRKFRNYGGNVEEVVEEGTELYWYLIPFGYTPYWQRKYRAMIETFAWEFIAKNEQNGTLFDWSNKNMTRTYSDHRVLPSVNVYESIRGALKTILASYASPNEELDGYCAQ